jgi:hypothetical protein
MLPAYRAAAFEHGAGSDGRRKIIIQNHVYESLFNSVKRQISQVLEELKKFIVGEITKATMEAVAGVKQDFAFAQLQPVSDEADLKNLILLDEKIKDAESAMELIQAEFDGKIVIS